RLRDRRAGELLLPIVVVALCAGEIELALSAKEGRPPGLEERARALVDRDRDRHPARLTADISTERQQLLALGRKRGRLLLLGPADVDALLEADRPPTRRIERRVARRHALHARARVAMAVGAGFCRAAGLALPRRLAVEHRQHAGIGSVVVLHRAG